MNMTNEEYIYQELVKIADKVGFEIERNNFNSQRLALSIGDYLNNKNQYLYKDHCVRIQQTRQRGV
jgi:hypothetical protein